MKRMNKRGQLTIFIIIGIVLLFSAALTIYIKRSITAYQPPVEVAFEQVPTELRPLQKFITECAQQVATDAIKRAGLQGGYLDTSQLLINDKNPTEGEGISFSPGSDIRIPYWYYMKSPNTCDGQCEFASKQPNLYRVAGTGNSLEEQIDKYVQDKLPSCLANFAEFKDQFQIEQQKITAITTIAKTDVFVQLSYPLTVKFSGREEKMTKFIARVPVNLGKFYDLASDITKKQIESNYLDFMALNLIDVYSGVDENKLPPLADTTIERGGFKKWLLPDVKNKVEELLMIHTPALQASGTSNFQGNFYNGNDPLAEGLYSLFILPLNKTYKADVNFNYLAWWPSYLKVTPSEGELIKPDTAEGFDAFISSIGINQYKFSYDFSYPVMVQISDPDALNGEGFTFEFALESNLRNNDRMKSDTSIISYSGRPKQTMACDPNNFNSGETVIDVSDSMTKAAVSGALVYFSFGREACFIGETQIINGKAIMKSRLPVGIGSLVVSKDGYISKTIPFTAHLDDKQTIAVDLDPFVDVDVSVRRIPVVPSSVSLQLKKGTNINDLKRGQGIESEINWEPIAATPDLESTQQAIISLIRTPENPAQEPFVAVVQLNGNENRTVRTRLVPGVYEIIGNLFDNQRTIIPEDQVCFPDDWYDNFGFGKDRCETLDKIVFDVFPKGGVSLQNINISSEALKGSKELVLSLFSVPDGYSRDSSGVTNMKHTDLEQADKVEEYSRDYRELVLPQFK